MNEEQLLDELHQSDPNQAIRIQNFQNSIGKLYSLQVPYQVTYEVISGIAEEDYLNVTTFSERGVSFYQEPAQLHNYGYLHLVPHFHDYYEMILVLEGSLTQYIEGNVYNYEAGSICFLNPNLLHKEQFHQETRLLFLGFSPEYLKELFSSAKASPYPEEQRILDSEIYRLFQEDLQHSGEKIYLDFIPTMQQSNHYQKIHDLAQALIETLMNPAFGTSRMVDGLLCTLLSFLTNPENYHISRVEIARGGDFLLFMHIVHLLEESEGRLSRAALSEHLHYSGDYLNRIIKKYTGMSLHEYRLKYSMKKAARLLTETDLPVSSILQELAFTNRTYFYRVFENYYGMTPKEYRKNLRPFAETH